MYVTPFYYYFVRFNHITAYLFRFSCQSDLTFLFKLISIDKYLQ